MRSITFNPWWTAQSSGLSRGWRICHSPVERGFIGAIRPRRVGGPERNMNDFSHMAKNDEIRSNSGVGKRLLNVREAALYMGLDVDTVYRKARLRELPSVKVGRALRFDLKALEAYVEQHTIPILE
jgi:excisionase family DNA binding protein